MQGPYIFIKKSNHRQRSEPYHVILLWALRPVRRTVACLLSATGPICSYSLEQRFSNIFQVGTTFISQNVLRTIGIIKLIRPALNSVRNMFLQQKIPLLLLRVE